MEGYKNAIERMARRVANQDNAITAHPIFMVQQKLRIIGIDADYTDTHCWLNEDNDPISDEDRAERVKEYREDNRDDGDVESGDDDYVAELAGLQKVGYLDIWENVQPFFTRHGADNYIEINKHNLKEPRVYVQSGYRNTEWQVIRHLLLEEARATWYAWPEVAPPMDTSTKSVEVLVLVNDGSAHEVAKLIDGSWEADRGRRLFTVSHWRLLPGKP